MKRVVAIAVIVAAALVVFGPAFVKREAFVLRDHSDYFQPMRIYTAQHLRAGRLPLWNPYNASGEPWIANPQTAVFYPPAWLFLILPFATAYTAYLFVHALLLGISAHRLFLRDATPFAATGGAIALMLSGPVLSLLDVSNNFTSFAWLPLVILFARDRKPIAGGVVLAMSFLAGEPFFAAIAALIFVIIVREVKAIAIAASIAIGVSAIQLFPFLATIARSNRVNVFSTEEVLRSSMTLRDWLRVFVIPRFAPSAHEQFIVVVYVGALIVLLAIAGCLVQWRKKKFGWTAMLVVAIVIASGPRLLAWLPLEIVRYPARVVAFAAFALVALAVAAWPRNVVISVVLTLIISADLFIAARPLLVTAPFTRARVPYPLSIGRTSKILQLYGTDLIGGSRASWIAGYTNLFDLRFAATTAAPFSPRSYDVVLAQRSLREMSIGYVLSTHPLGGPFERVAQSQHVVVYRVPHALPMAYVITPRGETLPPLALGVDASSARVIVDTIDGGTLVLTQNDEPGWRVMIDGRDAKKKLAFGAFRAVDITPGKHEVIWKYRPLSLLIGAIVTLLTTASVIVALLRTR